MAACADYEGMIAGGVYRDLTAGDQARLDQHLVSCAACRREFADFARAGGIVGSGGVTPTEAQRQELRDRVARKIQGGSRRAVHPSRSRSAQALPRHRGAFTVVAVAAGLLLAIVAIVVVARSGRSTQPGPVAGGTKTAPVPPPPVEVKPVRPEVPPPVKPPPPQEEIRPAPPVIEKPPVPVPPPVLPPPSEKPPAPEKPPAVVPQPPPPPPPKERETVVVLAHLERVTGEVQVVSEAGRVPGKVGMELLQGQELQTVGRASFAEFKCTDSSRAELGADTTVRFLSDRKAPAAGQAGSGKTFQVEKGLVTAKVAPQPAGQPMVFLSANAEARVLGTTLKLRVDADYTRLEVLEGRVRLTRKADGASVEVAADHYAVVAPQVTLASKPTRVHSGLQALYLFQEGRGGTVHDASGTGAPLDLQFRGRTGAVWDGGGLALRDKTLILSEGPATKIMDACRKTNEITLETWIKPARAALDFEGYVVGVSADLRERNVSLVQGEARESLSLYAVALRTSTTDDGGSPSLLSAKNSVEPRLTHVVFVRQAGGVEKLYVNGTERATRKRTGTFANWNGTYQLLLGNEIGEERPWLGEYRLVAVYSRALAPAEVTRNFKIGVD